MKEQQQEKGSPVQPETNPEPEQPQPPEPLRRPGSGTPSPESEAAWPKKRLPFSDSFFPIFSS